MNKIKRTISIVLLLTVFLFPVKALAQTTDSENNPLIKVLFLGNSLFYKNSMDTEMFPNFCLAKGKNVEVTSITESGTTLVRLTSDRTQVGINALEELENGDYDYIIISPSRKATPFESSVYNAEKQAALFIIDKATQMGAKTLVCAQPGLATGIVPIYRMNSDGINATEYTNTYMNRASHEFFYKLFCYDICDGKTDAKVVNIGDAVELLYKHYDLNLYKEDLRHPNRKSSYLSASCIYSAIFNETAEGCSFTDTLFGYNAITIQRASAVAVLGSNESIITKDDCKQILSVKLTSNTTAKLSWTGAESTHQYNIYRKTNQESYKLIATTKSGEASYKDKSLKSGKTYYYKIKAVNTVGDLTYELKDFSSSVKVSTIAKVKFKSVSKQAKKQVLLKYSSAANADYYKIYRKRNNGKFKVIATVKSLQYTDKKLKKGNYTYYIRGYNSKNKIKGEISLKKSVII